MNRPSDRTVLWLAAGLVAVSVGLAAGPLPWRFAGESGLATPSPAAAPASGKPAAVSLAPIIALSPFGRLAEAPAPEPQPEQETALGLVLLGVVIATDPKASTAILDGGIGTSRVYSVGDAVAADATLEAVFVDHVVLMVGGRRETLSFPARVPGSYTPPPPPEPEPESAADADPAAMEPDPAAGVEQYRTEIEEDPQMVLDQLGLAVAEGGYAVQESASGVLLDAGLQPGDLVTTVNGQQVGNIDRDRAYFSDVVAAGHARIELLRNGRRIVLSFPLR